MEFVKEESDAETCGEKEEDPEKQRDLVEVKEEREELDEGEEKQQNQEPQRFLSGEKSFSCSQSEMQPPARSRSSSASKRLSKRPPSASTSSAPDPEPSVRAKTVAEETIGKASRFKKGVRPGGTPPSEQKPRS
ncbi:hypothetical protein cypCar_00039519 [Cyprinus carpio]|nr:hypothetical protein cypCar_00039519 [Cyprinus carpio]